MVTKRWSNKKRQHVKSKVINVQPTIQPVYQVLAYESELNNFKVYGLRAHRETAVPLAAEMAINRSYEQ